MQSSYKGYFLEEEKGKIHVYDSVDAWRAQRPICIRNSEQGAKSWIDDHSTSHNAKAVKSAVKRFQGPRPEGSEPGSSIRAVSGGLPSLGKGK